MQFLHMVGMVLHQMQDLLFVFLNVEVNTAYTRNDRNEHRNDNCSHIIVFYLIS